MQPGYRNFQQANAPTEEIRRKTKQNKKKKQENCKNHVFEISSYECKAMNEWDKDARHEPLFLNRLRATGQIFFSGGIYQFWAQKLSSGKGTLLGGREASRAFGGSEELEIPGSPNLGVKSSAVSCV